MVDSPASVEQILSAFGDEDYWNARLAEFAGGTATLDTLSVNEAGTVGVTIQARPASGSPAQSSDSIDQRRPANGAR